MQTFYLDPRYFKELAIAYPANPLSWVSAVIRRSVHYWRAVRRRYMSLETLASLSDDGVVKPTAVLAA